MTTPQREPAAPEETISFWPAWAQRGLVAWLRNHFSIVLVGMNSVNLVVILWSQDRVLPYFVLITWLAFMFCCFGMSALLAYVLAVRYALRHPFGRRSLGVKVIVAGSVIAVLSILMMFGWVAVAPRFALIPHLLFAALVIGGVMAAVGCVMAILDALEDIFVR